MKHRRVKNWHNSGDGLNLTKNWNWNIIKWLITYWDSKMTLLCNHHWLIKLNFTSCINHLVTSLIRILYNKSIIFIFRLILHNNIFSSGLVFNFMNLNLGIFYHTLYLICMYFKFGINHLCILLLNNKLEHVKCGLYFHTFQECITCKRKTSCPLYNIIMFYFI